MSGVVDFVTGKSGDDAAAASLQGAQITAAGQEEALDYLKSVEELPQYYRESAMAQLAGLYGIPFPSEYGTTGTSGGSPPPAEPSGWGAFATDRGAPQAGAEEEVPYGFDPYVSSGGMGGFMDSITQSPLYQAIMGTSKLGEESIMRNASATGGLRSGNVQSNMYDFNQRLGERATLESYMDKISGLTGLAGMPSNAPQIAGMAGMPAATMGQGVVAGAQAQQANTAGLMQGLFGLGGAALICDSRLKENTKLVGESNGHKIYAWKWTEKAAEKGYEGVACGVMAHEVAEKYPDAVGVTDDGYLFVDYNKIDLDPVDLTLTFTHACIDSLEGVAAHG